MAKWYGKLGFISETEDDYGVVKSVSSEKSYFGDMLKNYRKFREGSNVNEKITISNELSIISDPFLYNNLQNLRYVEYIGTKWKIDSIDVQYPRIVLSLGGEYING